MTVRILFCLCLLLSYSARAGATQQPQPSPPAPARPLIEEFIRLINSGDRKAARSFVERNYTPAALAKGAAEQHVNAISELHDKTRGVEIKSLRETKPDNWSASARTRVTGQWVWLAFGLDTRPSPRVDSFDWGFTSAPRAGQPAPRKLSELEIVRELGGLMSKLAAADLFSGSVLLAKDGKVLFKQAYGEANKDFAVPNRADTKFNLASLNKMFTAVAAAQLVERGKLSFDDPISKYLPDFPSKEAAEKIKVKHLLTHTSGLGDIFTERWYSTARHRFRTVDDYLAFLDDRALAFEPGTGRSYSNTGFIVLGKIIEKIAGQSYFDYVRENIYKRAGMTNSDSYDLDLVNSNLAVGYDKEYTDAGIVFRNNLYLHVIRGGPAGGGFSTVEDLLRFTVALRSGRLVGEEYVRMITTPKPELNSPNYGYGFGVLPEDGIVAHSGGAEGISAHLEMLTADGYTFALLSNYGGDTIAPITFKLRELLLPRRGTRK
jgi:CubicO group peptidase (beta-lactamase class C family)